MHITFLRHGIAINYYDPQCPVDFERYLTDQGIERMESIAKWMEKEEFGFDRIYTSPLVRARQTAEIVAKCLKATAKMEVANSLSCGASLSEIRALLKNAGKSEKILLVGHAPDFGHAVSLLIGAKSTIHYPISLKKGGFAGVRADKIYKNEGELLYLIQPKLIVGKKKLHNQKVA
ncbi:MAG: phosphohistidine phosphatase SixA [Candidatus Cloacimonetes bacterium 4572_55]|nr:MAG: phosphohistidine phosphatase SixA [Candidatus Cloacimonetes bacterium 4572_55]